MWREALRTRHTEAVVENIYPSRKKHHRKAGKSGGYQEKEEKDGVTKTSFRLGYSTTDRGDLRRGATWPRFRSCGVRLERLGTLRKNEVEGNGNLSIIKKSSLIRFPYIMTKQAGLELAL